jgi:hypothetical protein
LALSRGLEDRLNYLSTFLSQDQVVFLVHRPDLEQLDEACRYLQSCFRHLAWVEREQD